MQNFHRCTYTPKASLTGLALHSTLKSENNTTKYYYNLWEYVAKTVISLSSHITTDHP
ncbi:hypothetical protein SPHINGO8BC_50949 [Sphingobacterium multivorum]|uniref:Uncharacterized protein n=1 Tax=Sphingobacterium multivorum TaxID=28454 RepID=A0A654CHX8_SPHMU|nr:hypothetical protein SPHINGO8BC_50949 [Sphingobacterium multivorum]